MKSSFFHSDSLAADFLCGPRSCSCNIDLQERGAVQGAAGAQNFDENGDVTSEYELWEFTEDDLGRVELIDAPSPEDA